MTSGHHGIYTTLTDVTPPCPNDLAHAIVIEA